MNYSVNSTMHRQLFDTTLSRAIDTVYVALSLADILCNSLVCVLFYKNKSMRKPFNILLFNLSLADMASALTIQPFVWIDFTALGDQVAAGFQCASSVGLLFFMSSSITNILTLTAITVVRYLGIVRNYQGSVVTSETVVTRYCVMTWVIGVTANIPNGLSFQYNRNEAICYRHWPKGINGNLYSMLTTLFFMIMPILTMVTCYLALAVHVWKRSVGEPGRNIAAVRARKSVTTLVGFLVLAFIVCWSPFFTIWIIGRSFNYFPKGAEGEYERQRWLRIGMIFALTNSVLDPFIYTYSSPEYRKGMTKLLCAPWREKELTRPGRAFTLSSELARKIGSTQV